MTNEQIEQKVKAIIAEKFAVAIENLKSDTRLVEDLHVDSFGAVELMFELEESFGLSIPDSDITHIRTVQQIVTYISEWSQKKTTPPPTQAPPSGATG